MSSELERIFKPQPNLSREIALWVTKCGQHFRVELTEADFEIFADALRGVELWRIRKAFERCLNECEFMPKLADVWSKMPEAEPEPKYEIPGMSEAAQEWTEEYEGRTIHYKGDPKGMRIVTQVEAQVGRYKP
jgi:hypothetical protein